MEISGRISSNSYIKKLASEISNRLKKAARNRGQGWYSSHMAAASRAIVERIPLVDFVLEVRDATIPLSSKCELLNDYSHSHRHIIVMNKMDLASRSQILDWMGHFEEKNCLSYAVNSHNKDDVKQFLNYLQAQVRKLKKIDHSSSTITMMMVGIPNVGKSALARSLHHIGRISASEKGKLRQVIVSPHPGETKDIASYKIASHPNIYVLDSPGIFPPRILDEAVCSKLALAGTFRNGLVEEKELARYFLAILNLSDEYKNWAMSPSYEEGRAFTEKVELCSKHEQPETKRKKQHLTDHTQDFIVNDARRNLFETISSFDGDIQNETDMEKLIELQFAALIKSFHLPLELGEDVNRKVATKLLNLYRTGRLGHYILDS